VTNLNVVYQLFFCQSIRFHKQFNAPGILTNFPI
jgi:hypothetical protein